jgi:hypothetical protein
MGVFVQIPRTRPGTYEPSPWLLSSTDSVCIILLVGGYTSPLEDELRMSTDVMRIALTGLRMENGLPLFYGVVINEFAQEIWNGPPRTKIEVAQTDANQAAEDLTVPTTIWAANSGSNS